MLSVSNWLHSTKWEKNLLEVYEMGIFVPPGAV